MSRVDSQTIHKRQSLELVRRGTLRKTQLLTKYQIYKNLGLITDIQQENGEDYIVINPKLEDRIVDVSIDKVKFN